MELVLIKFTRVYAPYNSGEVAGFPPARAEEFVNSGFADYVTKEVAAPPAPPVQLDPPAADEPDTQLAGGAPDADNDEAADPPEEPEPPIEAQPAPKEKMQLKRPKK